jgi:HPt (histidine-containing phosphotransfer) domain-containing protein
VSKSLSDGLREQGLAHNYAAAASRRMGVEQNNLEMGGAAKMNPTTQDTNDKVFNVDELLARCMGNANIAERILSKFQERFGIDLSELEQGLAEQNAGMITQAAHRIKGASANVSALTLYEIASDIEQLGREERLAEIPAGVQQLRAEWTRFLDEISTVDWSSCAPR